MRGVRSQNLKQKTRTTFVGERSQSSGSKKQKKKKHSNQTKTISPGRGEGPGNTEGMGNHPTGLDCRGFQKNSQFVISNGRGKVQSPHSKTTQGMVKPQFYAPPTNNTQENESAEDLTRNQQNYCFRRTTSKHHRVPVRRNRATTQIIR